MMKHLNLRKLTLLLLVVMTSGCATVFSPRAQLPPGVEDFIAKAPVVYLHSVRGGYGHDDCEEDGTPVDTNKYLISKWGNALILASVKLDDKTRKKVMSATTGSLREGNMTRRGFLARHAIEARDGTNSVVLVISFDCRWVEIRQNGGCIDQMRMTAWPESRFDRILRKHGIKREDP